MDRGQHRACGVDDGNAGNAYSSCDSCNSFISCISCNSGKPCNSCNYYTSSSHSGQGTGTGAGTRALTKSHAQFDFNRDLGERCGIDAAIVPLISSASIACSGRASDAAPIRTPSRCFYTTKYRSSRIHHEVFDAA